MDKSLSLSVVSAGTTAIFIAGTSANSGLSFADAANNSASFQFVLPANSTPGTALTGRFTWHTTVTSCGVLWRSAYTAVSRAGQPSPIGLSATSGFPDPGVGQAAAVANTVQSSTFTLSSPADAFTLRPGDSYTFGIFRSGGNVADSCTAAALIDSMVLTYS